MPAIDVEITNDRDSKDDQLEVTMRGTPEALIRTLVNGLNRDSLLAIKDALEAEMAKRTADRS